jgi:hypothetical protein
MDEFSLLQYEPFSLTTDEKDAVLLAELNKLHTFHYQHSEVYKGVVNNVFTGYSPATSITELPFLPVSSFKRHSIKSISDPEVFKVLTSSGTTGQSVSRIYLDKETAALQTLALSKILGKVIGKVRLPMLIVDSKSIYSNKTQFSARAAGVIGLSVFGKDHTYILDDNFEVKKNIIQEFFEKYHGKPILIFGFTFMVWQYLYKLSLDKKYDLSQAIMIHSGGWKKMEEISVDNIVFRKSIEIELGINKIFNFYGMVEQVGSIFIENKKGSLHCPIFADIIIRNPKDFSVQPLGVPGLIQVVSALPRSYPGHSLLTEDIGVLEGEITDKQDWLGKYFRVLGRASKAELRGCSDTFRLN